MEARSLYKTSPRDRLSNTEGRINSLPFDCPSTGTAAREPFPRAAVNVSRPHSELEPQVFSAVESARMLASALKKCQPPKKTGRRSRRDGKNRWLRRGLEPAEPTIETITFFNAREVKGLLRYGHDGHGPRAAAQGGLGDRLPIRGGSSPEPLPDDEPPPSGFSFLDFSLSSRDSLPSSFSFVPFSCGDKNANVPALTDWGGSTREKAGAARTVVANPMTRQGAGLGTGRISEGSPEWSGASNGRH